MTTTKISRRDQILQVLAVMLEKKTVKPVTTAALAAEIKISEAALYRHFRSKTDMFNALIDFIENTLFSRVSAVMEDKSNAVDRIKHIVHILLLIVEHNKGMSRILTREALANEDASLHIRVDKMFARLDVQIKQVLKEAINQESLKTSFATAEVSKLILSIPEGLIQQFIRSNFTELPTKIWHNSWKVLAPQIFVKMF